MCIFLLKEWLLVSVLVLSNGSSEKIRTKIGWADQDNIFFPAVNGEVQWCFSQVKGTIEEEVSEGKICLVYIA